MCGIAAILKQKETPVFASTLDCLRDEVSHRGPDDQGSAFFARSASGWVEVSSPQTEWQVGLAHRRLSILDLTPAGHQPMVYRERLWTVFNGEIFNFIELRAELEGLGHVFRSSSDTEVLLAAYAEWGPCCFQRFRGMWAVVILDLNRSELLLCRDRLGIKPLYLWHGVGLVAAVSE